ncbi:mitochondrial import receptor subunit TOM22 homolog [Pollicipes pollicipes]|uniref:mitochondrial import receptor subunit TOM22 homolog n=1 Tax=Pollicipes pollicipes TaxID=41117 RepID=UPI001884AE51|nr:mitochondrial import receptor subunit TOM22 homolog [Pollicipes pollicipes]XP_037074219.1 mitochondrial import receptor subunit TOM22 homolog [Pollicipes pollicipes]XP_037074220.1 mitochondrial import receptor subunit TOM22 homolog [Pollicipes pollicipes]
MGDQAGPVAEPAAPAMEDSLVVARPGSEEPTDIEDDIDETLGERLLGLTEMLPATVRDVSGKVIQGSVTGVKGAYGLLCSSSWIFFSSAAILLAPLVFEIERTQMEEMHKQQQRQILLGPNAAVSGSMMSQQAGM